jgi:hypothetical protein
VSLSTLLDFLPLAGVLVVSLVLLVGSLRETFGGESWTV